MRLRQTDLACRPSPRRPARQGARQLSKDEIARALPSAERHLRLGEARVIGEHPPEEGGIVAWMEEAFRKAVSDSKDKSRKS